MNVHDVISIPWFPFPWLGLSYLYTVEGIMHPRLTLRLKDIQYVNASGTARSKT